MNESLLRYRFNAWMRERDSFVSGKGLHPLALVLLVAGLGVLVRGQFGKTVGDERIYESTAILQVASPVEELTRDRKEGFLRSEAATMVSDEVLEPVVAKLKLAQEWSLTPRQSVMTLRGRTKVIRLSDREERARFSISVRTPDAELTRAIASEIASEYQRQGNAKALLAYQQELDALNKRIAEQEKLVEEKRARLQTL